jgi:hypothetical protein
MAMSLAAVPWGALALLVLGGFGCSDSSPGSASQTNADPGCHGKACAAKPLDHEPCVIPEQGLPLDLFCTGLYVAGSHTELAAGVRPYAPGVTLWSDGAEKQRFLELPEGTKIDTRDLDAWKFPVDTKAWKEFRLDGRLVETRLFWKRGEHNWASGTYVWNTQGDAATLNLETKPVLLDSGYEIPAAKDCGKCHHGGSDKLLGVEAVALGLRNARGFTLQELIADGALSDPPAEAEIALPEDDTGLAGKALGYLHANCGMACHSSRGLGHETELVMRLRAGEFWSVTGPVVVSETDTFKATVSRKPTTASVADQFPAALRITPGDHAASLVWELARIRGDYQMPPLVSHVVDEQHVRQLADWIDALPAQ